MCVLFVYKICRVKFVGSAVFIVAYFEFVNSRCHKDLSIWLGLGERQLLSQLKLPQSTKSNSLLQMNLTLCTYLVLLYNLEWILVVLVPLTNLWFYKKNLFYNNFINPKDLIFNKSHWIMQHSIEWILSCTLHPMVNNCT